MFGWRGRLLRVNLANGAIKKELLDPGVARNYLGGRGLGAYLHTQEVPASSLPLSAANHLIFATGPLTGTLAPNGGRYTVVTKTPPAGQLAAASISGKWGPELKFAGFDAIIFEGKAAAPVYLWIKDGKAELRSASHLAGKRVGETTDLLLTETDGRAVVSCIGPAGENGVNGSLVVSDYFSAAGGCGTGIVMGDKNLKAVVVCGNEGFRLADYKGFLKLATELRVWMKTKPIAARGAFLNGSVLLADSVAWDATQVDFRPARTRGCFGCATSFSSFAFDNGKGHLSLTAGIPPGELGERLKEYRYFTDLGLDFASTKTMLASHGKEAKVEHAELARRFAEGDSLGLPRGADAANAKCVGSCKLVMDRGACFAAGYAIVPRIPLAGGQDEALSDLLAVLDSAGLCPFLAAGIDTGKIAELLTAATGMRIGGQVLKI